MGVRGAIWLCLLLAACQRQVQPPMQSQPEPSPAAPSGPLVLWHTTDGPSRHVLDQLVRSWNLHHPDTEVQMLAVAETELTARLQATPAPKRPHLLVADAASLAQWSQRSRQPPPAELAQSERPARFEPETLAPLRRDGALIGLPLRWQLEVLYYNPRLVPKPPTTVPELLDLAARTGTPCALAYDAGDLFGHALLLHAAGGTLWDAGQRRPTGSSPAAVDALRRGRALVKASHLREADSHGPALAALFGAGQTPFVVASSDFGHDLGPEVPWAVAPLPRWADGAALRPLLRVEAMTVLDGGPALPPERRSRAMAFVDFATSDEAALVRLTQAHQLVANRKVYENPRWRQEPWVKVGRSQLAQAVPWPADAALVEWRQPYAAVLREAVFGEGDPSAALTRLDERIGTQVRPEPGVRP